MLTQAQVPPTAVMNSTFDYPLHNRNRAHGNEQGDHHNVLFSPWSLVQYEKLFWI